MLATPIGEPSTIEYACSLRPAGPCTVANSTCPQATGALVTAPGSKLQSNSGMVRTGSPSQALRRVAVPPCWCQYASPRDRSCPCAAGPPKDRRIVAAKMAVSRMDAGGRSLAKSATCAVRGMPQSRCPCGHGEPRGMPRLSAGSPSSDGRRRPRGRTGPKTRDRPAVRSRRASPGSPWRQGRASRARRGRGTRQRADTASAKARPSPQGMLMSDTTRSQGDSASTATAWPPVPASRTA